MVNQCDRCCQRARTWWALIDDTHDHDEPELMLCGHCTRRHADALVAQGWVQVADERGTPQLTPTPAG